MARRSRPGTGSSDGRLPLLRYRTRAGVVRFVGVEPARHGRAWLVVDTWGLDRRVVERLDPPEDGVEQAIAVAHDYASEAEFAGGPLVASETSGEEAKAA